MKQAFIVMLGACSLMFSTPACEDSPPEGEPTTTSRPTSGPGGGGVGGGAGGGGGAEPDCYENPQTHLEIINACTDAEQIDKNPTLPLLEPDGSLPPLP